MGNKNVGGSGGKMERVKEDERRGEERRKEARSYEGGGWIK